MCDVLLPSFLQGGELNIYLLAISCMPTPVPMSMWISHATKKADNDEMQPVGQVSLRLSSAETTIESKRGTNKCLKEKRGPSMSPPL